MTTSAELAAENLLKDSALYGRIDSARESFYDKLDTLVPSGVTGAVWLIAVETVLGEQIGYHEWIQELWE